MRAMGAGAARWGCLCSLASKVVVCGCSSSQIVSVNMCRHLGGGKHSENVKKDKINWILFT